MYCKQAKNGWITHIPAPGGWWEIQYHTKTAKYHLSFIATISPQPDCTYSKGDFDTLSETLSAIVREESLEEEMSQ